MQISQINSSSYNNFTFGKWHRSVLVPGQGLVHKNDTSFFREQGFWLKLTKMLSEKFKDIPKVNLYCYGCSDGSEAFSIAMKLLTMQDERNPQKFFPIIARDIDPVAIQKALNNDFIISEDEKKDINFYSFNKYDSFFNEPMGAPSYNKDAKVIIKKELYDNIDFKVGDILEDYKKINPKNSVILARNFWPYTNNSPARLNFFRDLYKHLDFGSYLVTGEFDHRDSHKLHQEIINAGFRKTSIDFVYVKD